MRHVLRQQRSDPPLSWHHYAHWASRGPISIYLLVNGYLVSVHRNVAF